MLRDLDGAEVERTGARTDREGTLEAVLRLPSQPGAYRVEARLEDRDEPLAEEWLVVEAAGDELADPRPDPELLESLAEATGGTFHADPEGASSLGSIDTARRRSFGVERSAPFGGLWAFVFVAAALVGEWILRRRWGRR